MNYLTLDDVYAIHQRMIHIGGGRIDIHDFTLLHSAAERPKASFGGKELYPTVWKKASALLQSLVKNHPFDDGNKRTAYYSTKRFLRINGYILHTSLRGILIFMVSVDIKNLSIDQIGSWLKKHSKKLA
jgi:death-on-curing protein